jgi:uncharacterized LabA/DUF88 family protein
MATNRLSKKKVKCYLIYSRDTLFIHINEIHRENHYEILGIDPSSSNEEIIDHIVSLYPKLNLEFYYSNQGGCAQ